MMAASLCPGHAGAALQSSPWAARIASLALVDQRAAGFGLQAKPLMASRTTETSKPMAPTPDHPRCHNLESIHVDAVPPCHSATAEIRHFDYYYELT